jgi:3-isopropylmalate/(R)-2-methylmalate dehydratase large subunit
MTPKTLLDKVWDAHVIAQEEGSPAVLYIDLHLIHDVTSPQAFAALRRNGRKVRRPDKTVATMDHLTPTIPLALDLRDELAWAQLEQLKENCEEFGVQLYEMDSDRRGIVHVIGPELGLTQPGMTVVCGDSHTSTHGAFGALAFGIGTSEVEHVLATQCLLQRKPKTFKLHVDGLLEPGVSSKDLILALIAEIGVDGGTGYALEYSGEAFRRMDMEQRMTVCNMSIEAGARTGMIAPDDTTFEYLSGREYAPKDEAWEDAVKGWRELPSDPEAVYDRDIVFDATKLQPMITYGTNPGMAIPITAAVPDPKENHSNIPTGALEKALEYMDVAPGKSLLGHKVDVVFLGSCTNGRLSDLRQAAQFLKGRKLSENLRMLVVPGSQAIKHQAEAEGLDRIFIEAGAEWRLSGCSMCLAMNGDEASAGQYVVSTSNRNYEGRQGVGARTFLASPLTAAASAVEGVITDVRPYL